MQEQDKYGLLKTFISMSEILTIGLMTSKYMSLTKRNDMVTA